MNKKLVIVESPTKAKTIGKFIGKEYSIKSSMGHIRDLPVRKLGIDIKNGFKPSYEIIKDKRKLVSELKKSVEKAPVIYIATDQDREGEAIGWHLMDVTNTPAEKIKRVVFHEITREAIVESFKNVQSIDSSLVNAQQARRILDRLVGYKISPLLSSKVKKGLSAGRVQSVAVRIIVEREEEIRKFKPQEYWTLYIELQREGSDKDGEKFKAHLISFGGKSYGKMGIKNKAAADTIVDDLKDETFVVSGISKKTKKRNPFPPFTTATLQQESYRKIGFSAQRTMRIAQQLYEGVNLEEGSTGIITYMRTDSLNIAQSARQEAAQYIKQCMGESYLPDKPRIYKTKSKIAQEAHEAIRPTSIFLEPEKIKGHLNNDQYRLYRLIWERFLASQMATALFDTVSVDIAAGEYIFRATGQTVKFNGFLKVYGDPQGVNQGVLMNLNKNDSLKLNDVLPEQHFTEPPPRYNEASLIRNLEAKGIGRPSTYAPIIATIIRRRYVIVKNRQFIPTRMGITVNSLLIQFFPEIVDIGFTVQMEGDLDKIAEGSKEWVRVLKEFYEPFENTLKRAKKNMKTIKPKDVPTEEVCERCGKPMVIRDGRFGKFLACSGFPKCRNSFQLDNNGEKVKPEVTDKKCEKCGKQMVIKSGRRGRFLACSGYPECRNTMSIDGEKKRREPKETDEECEKCGKKMVIRIGRRGSFMACSGYPACKNTKSITKEEKEEAAN